MKISMIVAMDNKRAIGKNGAMPWHIPKDFQWFKQQTMKYPVLMGRKCYEDIIKYSKGKPLPGRTNIILTTQNKDFPEGFHIVHSVEEFLEKYKNEEKVFIIGGEQIYKLFSELTDELYLTTINTVIDEPTSFFPLNPLEQNPPIFSKQDSDDNFEFRFEIYKKV